MSLREAAEKALEALDCDGESHRCGRCDDYVDRNETVRNALREALAEAPKAEAEKAEAVVKESLTTEPVAWRLEMNGLGSVTNNRYQAQDVEKAGGKVTPLYTHPPAALPESAETELSDKLREQKDAAYLERNQCVALIARMAVALGRRVCVTKTAIDGWSEDWHGCIYIDLPTGQVSWHFHDSQAYLFNDLPTGSETWDGHSTPEKYRRVAEAYGVDHENLYDLMRRQLVRINDWCCYATEEDTSAHLIALQQIGLAARAVLAAARGKP